MSITRFAPSPTGSLHMGGARTALFNWLHSRHTNGKFLLRIEDTDENRSSQKYLDDILLSMKWLGLDWDGEVVYQKNRRSRHQEIAYELLSNGKAYRCYLSSDEIDAMKAAKVKVVSPWRNKTDAPGNNKPFVIRIKAENEAGEIKIEDMVQGPVSVQRSELDDMVLLRSDGTPTYMLASVVDDHDMQIDTVIRGDDHLTNTFRQLTIYEAMGWDKPRFAHIPLIHSSDGSKLSKRKGAKSIMEYRDMGYLPESLLNYMLRLGWGGDGKTEIIDIKEAIKQFSIENVSKAPSNFDQDKLNNINSHYIAKLSEEEVVNYLKNIISSKYQKGDEEIIQKLRGAREEIQKRGKTLLEVAKAAEIYFEISEEFDDKSKEILYSPDNRKLIAHLLNDISEQDDWSLESLKSWGEKSAEKMQIKPGLIMKVLRAAALGTFQAPGVYNVMSVIGKNESLIRIKSSLDKYKKAMSE